ncbi:MAG: TIGR04086 family membrane protein [Oscillospiraceae bacterium]|nr:TIGR04086 family membrane protein [Oscillospiraceae bacterium]
MVRTKINTGKAASMPGGLALGAGISVAVTIILSAVIAKLVQTEALQQDQIGYAVMVLLITASSLGAAIAQGKVKHQRVLVCMLSGLIYYVILICITALFFGGQYTGFGVTGLLILGGAGTTALLSGRRKGRGGKRKLLHGV